MTQLEIGEGKSHRASILFEQVTVSERIGVWTSEQIGLDAEVISGHVSINKAAITGESMPVVMGLGN